MKKASLFLLFSLCSVATQAQITAYSNATVYNFQAIGGYAYFETFFTNISTQNPYSLSGPLTQNDFRFVASSPQGFTGSNMILTRVPNQPITLKFTSNNVKKMSCLVSTPNENIQITATSNLGNTITGGFNSFNNFVGFNVQSENEYITQVQFAAPVGVNTSISIFEMLIGDNTPQNTALNFDGINDHVAAHNSIGNFAASQSFTVTCWVRVAATQVSLANTDNAILEKWDGVAGAYPFVIRYLNSGPNAGKILARRYDGNEANSTVLISGGSINDGKWHHIAYVRESNGGLKLYIDGAFSNGDPDNVQNSTTNSSPLYIGSRNNINNFKGEIDEVRIWTVGKSQTEIRNEMFCKNPNTTNLQAAFNFNNGSPNNDNRGIISVVNSVNSSLSGILNNFAQTGDASNWVTGQVKYVKANATGGNNGSSWANAFTNLQSALAENTCNDLFDVYVATGTYKPHASNIDAHFSIQTGMKIYGGFAGTGKNISERNMALLTTTNETTLSGDLTSNDILSDFSQNRNDNSRTVVDINGKSNILIDGFSIRGGFGGAYGGGIDVSSSSNISLNNCKLFDNQASNGGGVTITGNSTLKASNCTFVGNKATDRGAAIYSATFNNNLSISMNNCVVSGHVGNQAILAIGQGTGILTHSYTNCTFVNNTRGFENTILSNMNSQLGTIHFSLKNSIVYGNTNENQVNNAGGTFNKNITYSLVQGETSTANGNLNGNTTNPQFVNPTYTNPNNAGNYRLKWCSLAIGAGNNTDISPLDLDRNPRNFNGTADMGAYEFLGNTPSQVNNSTISGTIDMPIYQGRAIQTITSTAKILVPAGAIDFKAPNSITLNPGFEARGVNKYFQAQIGANVGCMN